MNLQPWEWARATAAKEESIFSDRIRREDRIEYLRSALEWEYQRHNRRTQRVETLKDRIREVR